MIIAALVALFALVLVIIRAAQQQAFPAPGIPPTQTSVTTVTATLPTPTGTQTPSNSPSPTQLGVTTTPTPSGPRAFYIAPAGSEQNDGSKDHPWPLQYALNQPKAVQPGDTLLLQGGKYMGPFSSQLVGAEGKPINVRAVPGQRVTLESDDLVLDIGDSAYVNFWDLEITATVNNRDPKNPKESAYGIRINQGKSSHDIKFINLIVHDMPAQGFGWWQANTNSEIYGCLVYYNGITQYDHGIYVHNTDGQKRIIDNIIFDNASHGIHAYGEKDYQKLNNIDIEGNTVFDNGSIGYSTSRRTWGTFVRNILIGGYQVAKNPIVKNNFTYYPSTSSYGEAFNLGYRAGSENAIVENNFFVGGTVQLGGLNAGVKMFQNTILGSPLVALRGLAGGQGQNQLLLIKPADPKIFVRPNQYEPGRANITVYNWEKKPELALTSADLRDVQIHPGDRYELHNVQDYFNDVVTGAYDGQQISLPMTNHPVAQPMGLSFKPNSTFPEFGTFVLIVISSGN